MLELHEFDIFYKDWHCHMILLHVMPSYKPRLNVIYHSMNIINFRLGGVPVSATDMVQVSPRPTIQLQLVHWFHQFLP